MSPTMVLDVNALWFLLVGGAIFGAARMLLSRLDTIELTLERHGGKLIRIETKLGIKEPQDEV